MINVIIPLAGGTLLFENSEYHYPKPIIEIMGKPMIQLVIENLQTIPGPKRLIFIVNNEHCSTYYLDNTIKLLSENSEIIKLHKATKGAACSCLMAEEYINNDDPLIIVNGDQIIDIDYKEVFNYFTNQKYDAGVISFDSVHPRWSYVRLNENNKIVETTEKRPISKHAIAGFYYYSKGNLFIKAAFQSIIKDNHHNDQYFIAPTMNELVLENKNIGMFNIKDTQYHSFYSPQKIKEFEKIKEDEKGKY